MKHDLIGRVLKVLRIEKRPGDTGVSIDVEPKLTYTVDPTLLQPYQDLDIPHWRAIEEFVENAMGGRGGVKSLLVTDGTTVSINWQTGEAPDDAGDPSGETYADLIGNLPQVQVWLEVSSGTYQLESVPITINMVGTLIGTLGIDTSGIPARIIFT